jgi:hypothetical protein
MTSSADMAVENQTRLWTGVFAWLAARVQKVLV